MEVRKRAKVCRHFTYAILHTLDDENVIWHTCTGCKDTWLDGALDAESAAVLRTALVFGEQWGWALLRANSYAPCVVQATDENREVRGGHSPTIPRDAQPAQPNDDDAPAKAKDIA